MDAPNQTAELPYLKPSIYYGTFVYCTTMTNLSIRDGSLWVNEDGSIGGFADGVDPEHLAKELGWNIEDTPITRSKPNGFFFPGFVGM